MNCFSPSHESDYPINNLKEGDVMDLQIVDTHAHGRWNEYAGTQITPQNSVIEAAAGGIDTVFFMPNTNPRIIGPEQVQGYIDELSQPKLGKQFVHVNMTDNSDDRPEIEASLQHPNVVGIKIYPQGVTTAYDDKEVSKLQVQNGSTLRRAAQLCKKYNKTITIHCETPGRAAEADGALDFVCHTVFPLADAFPDVKIVVAHENLITSAEAIIAHNKVNANNIWMELGAKYMMLSRDKHLFAEDTPHGNPFYKCQPRLRDSHNNMALTGLLSRIGEPGVNLVFGNDHAPHPIWKKLGFLSKDDFLEENYVHYELCKHDMSAELFQKAPGGIADFRHAVEAMLTAALQYSKAEDKKGSEKTVTYGQLTKFVSGNSLEVYSALAATGLPNTYASFAHAGQWKPTEDFYNGDVYNVRKHENLRFKKQD